MQNQDNCLYDGKLFSLFFCCFEINSYICTDQASSFVCRAGQDIDGILRPTMPFVGQAKGKGVYERYRSVSSNFATLKHFTEDNRNGKRLRG